MRKITFLSILLLFAGLTQHLHAQSLQHTAWKAFFGGQVNDSLTLHIGNDSSFVTNGTGMVVVRSVCKIVKDTLAITDFDGQYLCPEGEGKYKFIVNGNTLILTVIEDSCEGRSSNISGMKWTRAL